MFTDVELELMTILWQRGEGTVRDVMAALPEGRNLAYTSVSTVLRILEQKGSLKTVRKVGQSHVYAPAVAKEAYAKEALHKVVTTAFDGTPANLVARLIDAEELSREDLARLKRLIDERLT